MAKDSVRISPVALKYQIRVRGFDIQNGADAIGIARSALYHILDRGTASQETVTKIAAFLRDYPEVPELVKILQPTITSAALNRMRDKMAERVEVA